jgi:hypothetical protein
MIYDVDNMFYIYLRDFPQSTHLFGFNSRWKKPSLSILDFQGATRLKKGKVGEHGSQIWRLMHAKYMHELCSLLMHYNVISCYNHALQGFMGIFRRSPLIWL